MTTVFNSLVQELIAINDYSAIDNYNIALSKLKTPQVRLIPEYVGKSLILRYYKDGSIDFTYSAVESNQKATTVE